MEIQDLLNSKNIDILFLCETDSRLINQDFKMLNYNALIHQKTNENNKTRIIALINDEISKDIIQRSDLEIEDYPIISIEINLKNNKKTYSDRLISDMGCKSRI